MRLSTDPSRVPDDYRFTHDIRVRFAETDAMGIVHHSRYLPYLEETRVAYLRSIGRPYSRLRDEGIEMAVVEQTVRYIRPLHFDEIVTVHLSPVAASRTVLQIAYLLTVEGHACSTAVTQHACIDSVGKPLRLPDWLRTL